MVQIITVLFNALVLGLFLLAFAFLLYTCYLVYIRQKYRHIPGPKLDTFYLGHTPLFTRERAKGKNFYQIIQQLSQAYGPVVLLWYYHVPFVTVTGSDLTKEALLTLNLPKSESAYASLSSVFGQRAAGIGILTECNLEIWHRKRNMLNPAFHRQYLKNHMQAFNAICDRFLAKVHSVAKTGTAVDMSELFSRVTLDVIGKVAFNLDLNAIQDADGSFCKAVYVCLKGMQESISDPLWKFNFMQYPSQRKAMEAARFLRLFADRVITERMEAMRYGEGTPIDILAYILQMMEKDPSVTQEELIDNFLTFFIAGQETTSNQLAFTVRELGRHPEIEAKLLKEINTVLDGKHYISYDDLGELKYLGQTLKESLRLHPPIGGLTRVTSTATTIGGYLIPAGTDTILSQFVVQRDTNVWDEPDMFNPDRFAPSHAGHITGPMYFPFSIGPRSCIGKALAQIEAKVIMARLYQEYQLTLAPGQSFGYEETITTRPKGGVMCIVTKR